MQPLSRIRLACKQLYDHPQRLCLTKSEMRAEEEARRMAVPLEILQDLASMKIFYVLSTRVHCVSDRATIAAMGQYALSHQLRLLQGAPLVKYRKEGKMS